MFTDVSSQHTTPTDHLLDTAIDTLVAFPFGELDLLLLRTKPIHQELRAEKPRVCQFMITTQQNDACGAGLLAMIEVYGTTSKMINWWLGNTQMTDQRQDGWVTGYKHCEITGGLLVRNTCMQAQRLKDPTLGG